MIDTQNNELITNTTTYIAPKNKTMEYITIINSRIYCVLGMYIFVRNKYWQTVFYMMKLNMSPNFKKSLQSKTVNSKKKSILPTTQCKNNKSPKQDGNVGNRKYIRKYLLVKLWLITVSEYSLKQLLSTCTVQKHSPRAINSKNKTPSNKIGASAAPSGTYVLPPIITIWGLIWGRQSIGLGDGLYQA